MIAKDHAKYYALMLSQRKMGDSLDTLSQSLLSASVDINPHKNEATPFAFKSPLSKGVAVAKEVGLIKEDVKKFSLVVREFRNYIHPYEQMSRAFEPDLNTAKICFQILKAAIYQISLFES